MGVVKVVHGANEDVLDVSGAKVSDIVRILKVPFNIPKEFIASVNGIEVTLESTVEMGDVLEVIKARGFKGMNRMFTRVEILRQYTSQADEVLDELFNSVRHDGMNRNGDQVWLESTVDSWIKEKYGRRKIDDGSDRMIPPSSVRVSGVICRDLTSLEYQLLGLLIESPDRAVKAKVIERAIYETRAIDRPNALTQVIKRLNNKAARKAWPLTVSFENGFVTLFKCK